MPGNIDNIIPIIPTIQQKAASLQEIYAIVNKFYFVGWPYFAVLRIPW
tara:strand:- start:59 stop:202 length:144 start_codon:yes stop_codon:yes gene_type:complete